MVLQFTPDSYCSAEDAEELELGRRMLRNLQIWWFWQLKVAPLSGWTYGRLQKVGAWILA